MAWEPEPGLAKTELVVVRREKLQKLPCLVRMRGGRAHDMAVREHHRGGFLELRKHTASEVEFEFGDILQRPRAVADDRHVPGRKRRPGVHAHLLEGGGN